MRSPLEWKIEFNRLYNNISSNQSPGLNDYEISKTLTDAQDTVVVGLYNGSIKDPFESTEDVTNYLAGLVEQETYSLPVTQNVKHIVEGSTVFQQPTRLLYRTFESCKVTDKCGNEKNVLVKPVTQDELWRTMNNPFRKQNSRRVLRLVYDVNSVALAAQTLSEFHYAELISDTNITSYTVRYLKRPMPIIVGTLPAGVSINGESTAMPCMLNEVIHPLILQEAVQNAKRIWQ